MADLMQQARELLAAEIGAPVTAGSFVGTLPAGVHSDAAIRAIAAVLSAAPEGYVLVPVHRGQMYVCPTCHGPGVVTKEVHDATRAARPQEINHD